MLIHCIFFIPNDPYDLVVAIEAKEEVRLTFNLVVLGLTESISSLFDPVLREEFVTCPSPFPKF